MAAKNIGFISEISGSAQVRTEEGVIKVLNIGDVVQNGDVLITGVNSQVVVSFYSGHKVQFGASAESLLDETVFSEQVVYSDQQVDQLDQVAALQQAIEEGIDLSELEAPAAGKPSQQSGGDAADALHQTSLYERDGREGNVDTQATPFSLDNNTIEQDVFGTNDDIPGVINTNTSDSDTSDTSTVTPPLNTAYVGLTGDASVVEGIVASYTVSVDQVPTTDIVVDLIYTGVASGADYSGVTSVVIPAGSSSVNFDVTTIDDVFGEGAEQFTVTISNLSGGGFDAIQVDSGSPSITTTINDETGGSIDTVLVESERRYPGRLKADTASYTLNVGEVPVTDVTVNFTYSGTATGSDYSGVASVVIPAGSSTFNFDVGTLNDAFSEGAEQFTISINSVTGGGFEAIAADAAAANVTTNIVDLPNTAPVAVDDAVIATEDTVFTSTIDLDTNDTDLDGDALSVVAGTFATSQGGSITIAADGSYTYTPAANFNGR